MTKKAFVELVKRAKSAKDKAEELALMAGKPTSTGVAAGAGLAALLASAGAIARSGEDPENTSILSNPLLLGSLGAAGGYLAGNAFERAPTRRADKDLSWAAMLGLGGGAGRLGALLAKEESLEKLPELKRDFRNISRRVLTVPSETTPGALEFLPGHIRRNGKTVQVVPHTARERKALARELKEFGRSQKAYQAELLGAGKTRRAIREAGYKVPEKLGDRILDFLKHSYKSPYRWIKALDPRKGGDILRRAANVAARRPWAAGAAGLALLAGGGKAIYDKVHD